MVIDRPECEREYGELRCEKPIIDYFRSDRFFVGCEGNAQALSYVIDRIGLRGCVFASDFPHEIAMEDALYEIKEKMIGKDIKDKHKAMILGESVMRFYKL